MLPLFLLPDAQIVNQLLVFKDVSHTRQIKIHFLSGLMFLTDFYFLHYLLVQKTSSW